MQPDMLRTTRIRIAASTALAVALAAAAPSAASAATYTLRPDSTLIGSWASFPSTTQRWDALDDAVTAPTAPATDTDVVYRSGGSGNAHVQLGLPTVTLLQDETVASAQVWAYMATGTGKNVVLWAWDGAAILGQVTVPANTPAGWQSVALSGLTSQSQVDSLTMGVTDSGGTGTSVVYAGYVELVTNDPPPPPPVDPPPSDPPPADPPPADPPPVDPPPVDPPVVDPPVVDPPVVDPPVTDPVAPPITEIPDPVRSEEHTSELQSLPTSRMPSSA